MVCDALTSECAARLGWPASSRCACYDMPVGSAPRPRSPRPPLSQDPPHPHALVISSLQVKIADHPSTACTPCEPCAVKAALDEGLDLNAMQLRVAREEGEPG